MRTAFLDDASPDAVSHAVRRVLEEKGALVSEHRPSRVKFHAMPAPVKYAFPRAGYVGIYQHLGEPEVMVRLIMRARWPHRILWLVALANVAVWLTMVVVNPSGTAWFLAALLTGFALVAAGLVYVGTLRPVREEELALMEAFEAAFAEGLPSASLETEEDREDRAHELELEAELVQRRLERTRSPASSRKGRRFSLRPKGPKEDEGVEPTEARRARLLARKAELEARRDEEAPHPPERR